MRSNLGFKVLAAAAVLAAAPGAFANTSLDTPTTGSIYLNVLDSASGLSFVFDTGLNQSTFNQNNTYTLNFASDPNWASFVAGEKSGDTIQYSVVSGTKSSTSSSAYSTSSLGAPSIAPGGNKITSAVTTINQYGVAVNGVTSTTTNTELTTGGTSSVPSYYGAAQPSWASFLSINDLAIAGQSVGFYSFLTNSPRSTGAGTVATFAGTWLLNGTTLKYSAVPLPAPWVLLLSALALMGVIARRGKFDTATGMPELAA